MQSDGLKIEVIVDDIVGVEVEYSWGEVDENRLEVVYIIELSFLDEGSDIFALVHLVDDHHFLFFVVLFYKSVSNWYYELMRYILILLYLPSQSLERSGDMRIVLLKFMIKGDDNSPIFSSIFLYKLNLVISDSS